MLTLSLAGVIIPIPLGFSMRLTWKSPATDFGKIPGGYGLGLSFPFNEHIRALFGNPERYAKYRSGNDQKFPGFEVRPDGVLLMAGTLTITSFVGGNYEGSLTDEIGVLGENEQERDILTYPAFTADIPWTNSANFDPAVHPYCCFPVSNAKFFKEKGVSITVPARTTTYGDGTTGTVDAYDTELLTYAFLKPPVMARVNAKNVDNTIKCIPANIESPVEGIPNYFPVISVVSPFFFLQQIITGALKAVDFHVRQNAFGASEILKMLCIYNNFDFTKTISTTENLSVTVYPYDSDELTQVVGAISFGYKITGYERSYGATLKTKDYLPKMKLGTLLLSTQNFLNLCLHFLPDNTVNIFSREQLITGVATDLEKYFLGTWDIGEKKDVALKFTHEQDGNDLIFSERFQDINDRIADVKEPPVADGDALEAVVDPEEGDIRFVISSNNYMEFKMITIDDIENDTTKDILGWAEYSVGFQNGWYNRGKREVEEIKTEWSTCYGNEAYTIVGQQGNMNSWKAKAQAFSPRLLIYKGNNTGGNESPDFSLDYEKAGKGIIPTFWKNWAPFWANRLPVTGSFDLPVNVLRHIIYNICNKYRTREGEFMIEEMSCEIFIDRIGTTEIKGFKV